MKAKKIPYQIWYGIFALTRMFRASVPYNDSSSAWPSERARTTTELQDQDNGVPLQAIRD